MKREHVPTIDDVARLIRGKRSQNRVGSRQIRHRLRHDEIERLGVARRRGFLLITPGTRNALRNAWYLDCRARNRPCLFVERANDGFVVTGEHDDLVADESGQIHRVLESLKEAPHISRKNSKSSCTS